MKPIKIHAIHDRFGLLKGYMCPKCEKWFIKRPEKCECGVEFMNRGGNDGK